MGNQNSQSQEEDVDDSLNPKNAINGSQQLATTCDLSQFSNEQVLSILEEILRSQERMSLFKQSLTQELSSADLAFETIYERVRGAHPNDPLEKHGLSMAEFEQLLDKCQEDSSIQEAVKRIRGAPSVSDKARSITIETLIEVHNFLVKQLDNLVEQQKDIILHKENYDMKIVAIAAQIIGGAKIQEKFGISSEEIDAAISIHRRALGGNKEFATANRRIGQIMSGILQGWGRASFMAKS
jgi:hypothetical protein